MDYSEFKENGIKGRYITYDMISPFLKPYEDWKIQEGSSVLGIPIPLYKVGNGKRKILMWSQMHGNESTATKAILDVFRYLKQNKNPFNNCELYIIPMLNPDGAKLYTRANYKNVDLNRDADELSQKESLFLRKIFDEIQPDFCFNLHDQRTIFGVGEKPATISFLAPSVDEIRSITLTRKKAMEVIAQIYSVLQNYIPNQIGRFDDSFNINCTGDKYSSLGVPTILFEAGHFPEDYEREESRKYMFLALIEAIQYINDKEITGNSFEKYFQIPENHKLFCDILIQNDIKNKENIAIQYEEKLNEEKKCIDFVPKIIEIGVLKDKKAHKKYILSEICKDNLSKSEGINYAEILKNMHF
ncbi:MAG: DUF2817 domain-containing protein [Capnocytophaga sp.]|nr:DUF2817 domain-containing protein [Capnocytophaga sp.]